MKNFLGKMALMAVLVTALTAHVFGAGYQEELRTFKAGGTIVAGDRVKYVGASDWVIQAGAADDDFIGAALSAATANQLVAVKLANRVVTFSANGAISKGADVYPAATGQVSATINGRRIGIAMNASVNAGDALDVYPMYAANTFAQATTFSQAVAITPATNQLVLGTTNTDTISATAPAASRVLTIPDPGAAANFLMSQGAQTIAGAQTFSAAVAVTPATNQLVLGTTNTDTINAAAPATSRVLTIPDPGAAANFLMSQGAQTVAGAQTFSAAVAVTPVTNQLVLGTTNTATINAAAPAASRVYTIPDPLGASNFVMTGTAFTTGNPFTLYQAGTGTGTYQAAGILNASVTSTGNGADQTEDVLQTFSLPANSLSAVGKGVRIRCYGQTVANADNKQVKVYFGASLIATGVAAANNKDWYMELLVYKTGANTQAVIGQGSFNAVAVAPAFTAGADNDAGAITIKCTGQDTTASTANAIVCKTMIVEYTN